MTPSKGSATRQREPRKPEPLEDACDVCGVAADILFPDGRRRCYTHEKTVLCACPRSDARDCADFRSGRDLRRMLDAETREDAMSDEDDGCQCACHEEFA